MSVTPESWPLPGGWLRHFPSVVVLIVVAAATTGAAIANLVTSADLPGPTVLWVIGASASVPIWLELLLTRRRRRIDQARTDAMLDAWHEALKARANVRAGAVWANWTAVPRSLLKDAVAVQFVTRETVAELRRSARRYGITTSSDFTLELKDQDNFFNRNLAVLLAEARVEAVTPDHLFAANFLGRGAAAYPRPRPRVTPVEIAQAAARQFTEAS